MKEKHTHSPRHTAHTQAHTAYSHIQHPEMYNTQSYNIQTHTYTQIDNTHAEANKDTD